MERVLTSSLFTIILSFTLGASTWASVEVPDMVGVVGRPLMLRAITKGLFLPKGGLLVDFYVDKRFVGRRLSGGDGLARLEYTPTRKGLFWIRAETEEGESRGLLLVVDRKEPLILVETETVVASSIIGREKTVKASKTLKKLSRVFRIIYISTTPLGKAIRKEIFEEDLPQSVVLNWEEGYVLEELREMGLKLHAYIGTGPNCELAKEYVKKALSFTETDECQEVEGWEEVEKVFLLKK